MLAVFAGTMSFALLSAFWMIRERSRILSKNQRLRTDLADLRALNDRNEALLNVPGQRVIVWNSSDENPLVLGNLPLEAGAPSHNEKFLAFGSWLDSESSGKFEPALRKLRVDGVPFSLTLQSARSGLIEANGNVTGSFAFVRFSCLNGEREEHARLKGDYEKLRSNFSNIEILLQHLPMPIWLRNEDGALSWVNKAYSNAVEATTPKEVVDKNLDLRQQTN